MKVMKNNPPRRKSYLNGLRAAYLFKLLTIRFMPSDLTSDFFDVLHLFSFPGGVQVFY